MDQGGDQARHLSRIGILVQGSAHGHSTPAPFHDITHLVQHRRTARAPERPAKEEDGYADTGHHAGDRALTLHSGCDVGNRDLYDRCTHIVHDHRGEDDRVCVAGHPAVAPHQRLNQGIELG